MDHREIKTKSLLLGELQKGDAINEGLLMDRSSYRGSPVTVIAKEDIEFAGVLPYGDWTQLEFCYEPPAYLSWTQMDLQRLHWTRVNQR